MKLNKTQKQSLIKTAKKYGLNFILLFGSQAHGRIRLESDLDIAYSPQKDLDFRNEYSLANELKKIFQSKKKIDLVNVHNAPPLLLHRIAFGTQVLAEPIAHSFASFQMYAFKIYVEAKPLFRLRDEFIKKNL